MIKRRGKSLRRKTVMMLMIAFSIAVVVAAASLVAVLASQTQTVRSSVVITYTSDRVDGSMRLRAYYAEEGVGSWHNLTNGTNGYITLSADSDDNAGAIDLTSNNAIDLDYINNYVVFECAFRNTGSHLVNMSFSETDEVDVYNMTRTQLISDVALSNEADFDRINNWLDAYSSVAVVGIEDANHLGDNYTYYYVKIKVTNVRSNAHYELTHNWDFTTDVTPVTAAMYDYDGTTELGTITGVEDSCLPILKSTSIPTRASTGSEPAFTCCGYYSTMHSGDLYYIGTTPIKPVTDDMNIYAQYSVQAEVVSGEAKWPTGLDKTTNIRVIIPDTATSIAVSAFDGCTGLIGVSIPDTITTIKVDAFRGCCRLTSIVIPSSVTSIMTDAFARCYLLTEVYNLSSLTIRKGWAASYGCIADYAEAIYAYNTSSKLEEINGIIYYKETDSSYVACGPIDRNITSITWDSRITRIKKFAFTDCISLTGVTIPSGVTTIGDEVFSNCTSVAGITIPSSVTSIGDSVFNGCSNLATISVDGNNENYSSQNGVLFNKDATTLLKYPEGKRDSQYIVPNSVIKVGYGLYIISPTTTRAFANNIYLTSVTIPSSVNNIGEQTFSGCISLTTVVIEGLAFNYGWSASGTDAFSGCTALTNVNLGNSIRYLPTGLFRDCTSLTSIVLPSSLTGSGINPFEGCTALESITGGNSNYYGAGNCFIGRTQSGKGYGETWLEVISGCKTSVIPSNVDCIGKSAFVGITGLTSINIEGGVETIRNDAFNGCTGLTNIRINTGVRYINDSAFRGCTNLTTVTIDSNTVSSGLQNATDFGYLVNYADTIYVYEECTAGSYVTSNYSVDTSDKTGYVKYVKNS